MITESEYLEWLEDSSAIPCVLVEPQVIPNDSTNTITRYLSTKNFSSNGIQYEPIVQAKSIKIVERILIGKNSRLDFNSVVLSNVNGNIDHYLFDVWDGNQIEVFIGDTRWNRSDFRPLFKGTIDTIDSRSNKTIDIKITNKLQRLNTPISDDVVEGITSNKNTLKPVIFGEVFNMSPILQDEGLLKYIVNAGRCERVIEVRDNGVPVAFTPNLLDGSFTLDQAVFGNLTASVQGDNVNSFNTTVSSIIQQLVTRYGTNLQQRFTDDDLDLGNLQAFNTAHTQPIGVLKSGNTNLLRLCREIAGTVGAHLTLNKLGKLQLFKLDLPPTGTLFNITEQDIVTDSLRIVESIDIRAAFRLGFNKNYTVQESLDTGIPAKDKEIFKQEWVEVKSVSTSTSSRYKLPTEVDMKSTLFLLESDAQAESNRLLNLFSVPRFIYRFRGLPRLTQLELGQGVNINHPRFGTSVDKPGLVVGLSTSWEDRLVDVEVFV